MVRRRQDTEIKRFYARCKEILNEHWQQIQERPIDHDFIPELREQIAALQRRRDKSYRYVLPTQLVAKLANRDLDCICIQDTRENKAGNFNARDVCKYVIVPWERSEGIPIGQSSDPYVNNPLRVPEFSLTYIGNRTDREAWTILINILSNVQDQNDVEYTTNLFHQVLQEIRRVQEESQVTYIIPNRISPETAINILNSFLSERSGGSRLQVVFVALFKALSHEWGIYDEVLSAPINVPDAPAGRPADIICLKDGSVVLAVEIKDRTLTLQLLEDKILSCRANQVTELLFLIRANQLISDESVVERAKAEFSSGINVYILDAMVFLQYVTTLIGETARRYFIQQIGFVGEELRLDFVDRRRWAEILCNA